MSKVTQVLSREAAYEGSQLELENYLIERVRKDAYFDPIEGDLGHILDFATFIGRASEQVDKFLREWIELAFANAEYHGVFSRLTRRD